MRALPQLCLALSLASTILVAPSALAQRRDAHTRSVVRDLDPPLEDQPILVAPPAPPDDPRPPRPFPDAVWTDGHYGWTGRAHVWVAGVWMRPIAGRRWSPWRWQETHGQWVLIPGSWVPSHQGAL